MGVGTDPPDRDPAARAATVHESERTRVTRLFLPGRTVVRKEPLGPDAERRLRHELAILERLRGVAGVAQLVDAPRYAGARSCWRTSAARAWRGWRSRWRADELIGLAAGLARAVAGMHGRGVMHRDITPANIVLSPDGAPCLVDFALATSFAEIRPEFTHHTEIVGTLAYLAPEQTGRTGRSVDQRADLYALGATLYELATGAPPFGTGDPLRLTHDHLARVPVPPAEVNPARAGGRCPRSSCTCWRRSRTTATRRRRAWSTTWSGCATAGRPAALRRRRARRPAAAAAALAAGGPRRRGRRRWRRRSRTRWRAGAAGCWSAAPPGVGKTALVDQLRPVVTGRDGWFVAGKFDQYRRDLEFDAVYQAFRALGRLLLAEPEDELAEVRERIVDGARPERGSADRGGAGVRRAAGGAARSRRSADRAGAGAARGCGRCCGRSRRGTGRWWCSSTTCSGPGAPRSASSISCCARSRSRACCWWAPTATPRWTRRIRWRRCCPGGASRPACGSCGWTTCRSPGSVAMVAEMLHVDRAAAAGLVEVIDPHTSGNPYETVELLNALRRDGRARPRRPPGGGGTPRPCVLTWAGRGRPGCWRPGSRRMPQPSRAAGRRRWRASAGEPS